MSDEVPCPNCGYLFQKALLRAQVMTDVVCPRCEKKLVLVPPLSGVLAKGLIENTAVDVPSLIERFILSAPNVNEAAIRIEQVMCGLARMKDLRAMVVCEDQMDIHAGIRRVVAAGQATFKAPPGGTIAIAFVLAAGSLGTGHAVERRCQWPGLLFAALQWLDLRDLIRSADVGPLHAVGCVIAERTSVRTGEVLDFVRHVEHRYPDALTRPPLYPILTPIKIHFKIPDPTPTRSTTMDPITKTAPTTTSTDLTTKAKTLANDIGSTLKAEGEKAAWQGIAEQAAKRTYEPFLARLKAAHVSPGMITMLRGFLGTRPGYAAYSFAVGAALSAIPRAQRNPYYARVASEMRILGMRVAIGEVLDPVLDTVFEIFDDLRDQAPGDEA